MLRRMLVCGFLLLVLHTVARAGTTLEDMEAEGGIPALAAVYLRAFNAQDEAALRSFIEAHRDVTSLARTPLGTRVARQLQMRGMVGELTPAEARVSTREKYELVVHSESLDAWFLLTLEASEFDPIRFGSMGLQPTEPPGQELPEFSGDLDVVVATARDARGLPALGVAYISADGTESVVVDGVRDVDSGVPVRADDRFHYGSITKSITASIAARLVDRGDISFETTLGEGLEGVWLHSQFRAVTLAQLLQHRAGVEPMTEDDPEREERWTKVGPDPTQQRRAMAAELLSVAPDPEPGTAMNYSNAGYGIAALMLEQASGSSWEELVQSEVADPLGLDSFGIGWPATSDHPDQPRGHWPGAGVQPFGTYELPPFLDPAGDVHGTVLDLARFGRALATGPEGWIEGSTRMRLLSAAGDDPEQGYAMGLMREEMAGRSVALHNGSAGTFFAFLVFVPGSGESIAVVMNEGSFANDALARRLAEAVLDGSVTVGR